MVNVFVKRLDCNVIKEIIPFVLKCFIKISLVSVKTSEKEILLVKLISVIHYGLCFRLRTKNLRFCLGIKMVSIHLILVSFADTVNWVKF